MLFIWLTMDLLNQKYKISNIFIVAYPKSKQLSLITLSFIVNKIYSSLVTRSHLKLPDSDSILRNKYFQNIVLQDLTNYMLIYIILQLIEMSQNSNRKYSKISSALKYYFFQNLYYQCLDIREAANKCMINYSTAKLILRDLTLPEKKCIKRLIRQKEKDEKQGMNVQEICSYIEVVNPPNEIKSNPKSFIEIISTVGYNFFAPSEKK